VDAVPDCQTPVRYCQHCIYNKDLSCKGEHSLESFAASHQEAECLAILQGNPSLFAVVHSASEEKCFTYDCGHTQVLTYFDDSKSYATYMRTCDTGMKPLISACAIMPVSRNN